MGSDELGKRLHDQATRGQALSASERAQLEAWYAAQDRAEIEELGLMAPTETVVSLQAQVDVVLAQLVVVTKRIQELAAENDALRREVAVFRHQLVQRPVLQLA